MTDIELTKLCGDAMGYQSSLRDDGTYGENWKPLHDDAQAMKLLKRFQMDVTRFLPMEAGGKGQWEVRSTIDGWDRTRAEDLNRAICECSAKCQEYLAQQSISAHITKEKS